MPTSQDLDATYLINLLNLQPHPEGGWYAQTFQDDTTHTRAASTMIYYLLQPNQVSHLHRIDASEGWHFYAGDTLNIIELDHQGAKVTTLGTDFVAGERPQYVVPKGRWFGAMLKEGGRWGLVGCSVAPGFEFEGFEVGGRGRLIEEFPACRGWIEKLTCEDEVEEEVVVR